MIACAEHGQGVIYWIGIGGAIVVSLLFATAWKK